MTANVHSAQVPRLVTISIPVFNEEDSIPALLVRLRNLADKLPAYSFEFLFTDNASTDRTFELLAQEAKNDNRIRVLRFSRNFGFQRSILTNYLNARGEAAVQIDADLQDPPELIAQFLDFWEQGYKVVFGVRVRRKESRYLEWARKIYYRLIDRLSETAVPPDAGDFRLIDKIIIDQLRNLRDQQPYLRGHIASLGYPQIGIPYSREVRLAGVSKFPLRALIRLAIDGICSQSTKPLRYIGWIGVFICAASALIALTFLVAWSIGPASAAPRGFTTLALLLLFSIGLNSIFLGVIGEYLARIFETVRGQPAAIIERRIENGNEVLERLQSNG